MDITFLLNGETVRLSDVNPTVTLLDWLREERGLTPWQSRPHRRGRKRPE